MKRWFSPIAQLAWLTTLVSAGALALEPDQIFERVSPSIWTVVATDTPGKRIMQGSAVVIGPGRLVTNCHVLEKAKTILVRQDNVSYGATLEFPDVERDLCQLVVRNFKAPAVTLGSAQSLRVGQRVYAIGSPRGLELSMSEGIVASLRGVKDGNIVQTTAAISRGSSGGGLFDIEGRLVGIMTFTAKDSQNLNFAHPVEWVAELPERGAEALARYRDKSAPASTAPVSPSVAGGLPRAQPEFKVGGRVERPDIRAGDQWRYQVTDLFTNGKNSTVMEVETVTADRIHTRTAQTAGGSGTTSTVGGVIGIWDRNWNQLKMGSSDYSPYYPSLQFPLEAGKRWGGKVRFITDTGLDIVHDVTAQVVGWERIVVPAGSFESVKIVLSGHMHVSKTGTRSGAGAINDTVWYSPAIGRAVRKEIRHTTSDNASGANTSASVFAVRQERWELLEYKAP